MKKMILVVSITMSMILHVQAQNNNDSESNLKFGVKIGLNITNANGNGVDLFTNNKSSSSRVGFMAGVTLEYTISDKFSVQPELHFSQQGFKTDINDGVVKLNYLNIPVMAKYYIGESFSVEMGPQIGFLLSSKHQSERQIEDHRGVDTKAKKASNEEDLKDYFKSTDFGLNFGITYQLNNGFGINARYNLGLKDIFDFSKSDILVNRPADTKSKKASSSDGDYVIKNRVIQVGVFYRF